MKEGTENYIGFNLIQKYGDLWITNLPKILNVIGTFINNRQNILSTRDYGERLIYTTSDQNKIYEAAGVDEKDLIEIVNSSPNLNHKIPDQMNPLYNLLFIMASFYGSKKEYISKHLKVSVDVEGIVRLYLGFRIYSICQRQIFHYSPRKAVVAYTLDHLTNRFVISKYSNLYDLIEEFVNTNGKETEKLKINMENPIDIHIYGWNTKLISRFKSLLKYLYRETEKNNQAGNYNTDEDIQVTNKESDKKFFIVNTNSSNTIEVLTNKVLTNFIQESEIRTDIVNVACKKANVNPVKIKKILEKIRNGTDKTLLIRLIKDILSYWIISLNKDVQSIHSGAFVKKVAISYSISNTNDIFVTDLKDVLYDILLKYAEEYLATGGSKTKVNSFKQSIFLYMVLYIAKIV